MISLSSLRIITRLNLQTQLVRPFASNGNSPWYIDNKPGPYPKTEEEKCMAAKKYGMLREEYEPYPDDGDGYGDYPKIEPENVEAINPYYPWADEWYRRNPGDPISADFIYYTYGRISHERQRRSTLFMITAFLGAMGIITAIVCVPQISEYRIYKPILEKQYYKPGVTHYTFDLVGEDKAVKH